MKALFASKNAVKLQSFNSCKRTFATNPSWPSWGDDVQASTASPTTAPVTPAPATPTPTKAYAPNKFTAPNTNYKKSSFSSNSFSTASPSVPIESNGDNKQQVYNVGYTIYKGKAAVRVSIIPATFSPVPGKNAVQRQREGALFLEFAPIGAGPREYDWTKKNNFGLSASECGSLLTLDAFGSEFLHDPNAGTAEARQVAKRLKFQPTQDGKGFFLSLQVADQAQGNQLYSVPITLGELEVLKTLARLAIPKILGFEQS